MYDFTELKKQLEDAQDWLRKEYQSLRTGRATPALLDGISIESYGARVPLNQAASIGVEDARTLRVTPWDVSQVKSIEKALTDADLGVGITADSAGARVTFPELTSERRESLVKIARAKLEDARQSVRGARDEAWSDIQAQEQSGDITEDEKYRAKEELQKYVDATNEALEAMCKKKVEEIYA